MSAGLKVECYSGYKVNERPLAFYLNNRRVEIKDIIDQWYGPDHIFFKIVAEDNNTYILRYSKLDEHWEFVFFEEQIPHPVTCPEAWKQNSSA